MPKTLSDWVEFNFLALAAFTRVATEVWSWPRIMDDDATSRYTKENQNDSPEEKPNDNG